MLQPIGDRILIQRDEAKSQTAGGIYIPDAYQEKSEMGVVLAVGIKETDTGVRVPMEIEIGDKVIFQKNMGTELTIGKDKCVLLESYDVFAIIEEN